MRYLLDSGILLRVVNPNDPLHGTVRAAVRSLKDGGHETVAAPENIAEFWNVCTRPASARGGLGLSVGESSRRLGLVERIVQVLPDHPEAYERWKTLIVTHGVIGAQVHDARLVAFMAVQGITHFLTLNADHFRRYAGLTVVEPKELISTPKA